MEKELTSKIFMVYHKSNNIKKESERDKEKESDSHIRQRGER